MIVVVIFCQVCIDLEGRIWNCLSFTFPTCDVIKLSVPSVDVKFADEKFGFFVNNGILNVIARDFVSGLKSAPERSNYRYSYATEQRR